MKQLTQRLLLAITVLLFVTVLFSLFTGTSGGGGTKILSLDELAKAITAGNVKQLTVAGNDIKAVMKDGSRATSKKETEAGLVETLKNYGVSAESLQGVAFSMADESGAKYWMGILVPALLPVIIMVALFWWIFRQARTGANQAFSFGKVNLRLFAPSRDKVTFKDVAGLKESKEELEEIVDFLKNPKKFLEMGARIPRGVLLMGPPGTGKTLLARATAGESSVPFFHLSASEFVEMFVGVGASRVRDLFQTAKKAAPSIIFIDEIDAVGRERGAGLGGGHDEREQTLNQILVEMDGFERDTNVIVMAASVTGDTPVLVREEGKVELKPIAEVINPRYRSDGEGGEKETPGLEALGFDRKNGRGGMKDALLFGGAAFKKVRSVFRHRVKEIFEIEYRGGTIRATGNHSVFVRSRRGLETRAVAELKPGDLLVDLPYKVNRTNRAFTEVRAYQHEPDFNLTLPVWQPLFSEFAAVGVAYQYAIARAGDTSQTQLGRELGFSQRTIGKWQQGICGPRALSRNYYQHKELLPERVRVTPDLMRLLGYYVAEGYSRRELDFCFNVREMEKVGDVKELMREIFGVVPDRERHITDNAVNIVYHSKPLAEFFAYHCGRGAHHKHVPPFLFTAPRSHFTEFLRGYFNGDGYRDARGRSEMTSVSKRLILELNWLARMHGFKSFIHSFTTKEGRRIKNGKPLKAAVAWRLGFGKTQDPLGEREGKASTERAMVKRVTKIPYDGYVYDFCGCDNEAFFGGASPVLLHNTNRPDILDSALLRPGRFDRRIILDMPDINDRENILKIHARGKPLDRSVDLRVVAVRTPGFSGADLANLMNEAAIAAARENQKMVTQTHLINSIEKVMMGPERRSRAISQNEKKLSAYHEAGHALVAAALKEADPVHKISIVSRGMVGGYTMKLPLEERRFHTRAQFLADLAVSFGGYAAELAVFKDISTGSSNDIRQATDLAHQLITKYGMSERLGPRSFGHAHEMIFLGRELGAEKDYSESLGTVIDEEVDRVIGKALAAAKKIVTKHRAVLDAIANTLVEKETIERDGFEALIKKFRLKPIAIV